MPKRQEKSERGKKSTKEKERCLDLNSRYFKIARELPVYFCSEKIGASIEEGFFAQIKYKKLQVAYNQGTFGKVYLYHLVERAKMTSSFSLLKSLIIPMRILRHSLPCKLWILKSWKRSIFVQKNALTLHSCHFCCAVYIYMMFIINIKATEMKTRVLQFPFNVLYHIHMVNTWSCMI